MNEDFLKFIDSFKKNKVYGQILLSFENGLLTMIKETKTHKPKKNLKKNLTKIEKRSMR